MHRGVVTVEGAISVRDAALVMKARTVGGVVVLQQGAPVGILTERDVTFRVVADRLDPDATRVDAIMSKPLATIAPSAGLDEASELMKRLHIKRLVVVKDQQVCGMLTATDIAYAAPGITREFMEGWVKQRWED